MEDEQRFLLVLVCVLKQIVNRLDAAAAAESQTSSALQGSDASVARTAPTLQTIWS